MLLLWHGNQGAGKQFVPALHDTEFMGDSENAAGRWGGTRSVPQAARLMQKLKVVLHKSVDPQIDLPKVLPRGVPFKVAYSQVEENDLVTYCVIVGIDVLPEGL